MAKDEFSAVVWDYHVILLLRRRNLEQEEAYPGRQTDRTSEGLVLQHQEVSHVAAAGDRSWVYDFDSRLPMPSTLEGELTHRFLSLLRGRVESTDYRLLSLSRSHIHGCPAPVSKVSFSPQSSSRLTPTTRCASLFRVIPGSVYLENFASDRSHMVSILFDRY